MPAADALPKYPTTQKPSSISSLSSSTTLHEESSEHHKVQKKQNDKTAKRDNNVPAISRPKMNTKAARQPKNNVRELGYQKVLRTMITESKEPLTYLAADIDAGRDAQTTAHIPLRSSKHTLPPNGTRKSLKVHKNKPTAPVFKLTDDGVASALDRLMADFGCGTHSSFLDDTYSIYMPDPEQAAICFKVIKKVAIMYGDPLCSVNRIEDVFQSFQLFCQKQGWHVAVVGARPALTASARKQGWRTMETAVEQVLNPMTNNVLDETSGKTITRTNRKLVASGVKLHLYEPRKGIQPTLERDLMNIYKIWSEDKGKQNVAQAYSAVINPFGMPGVGRFMYTCGEDGRPNSLAGLIQLGANGGYLLEPCIQLPDAPKGITGFLVTHAMGLLREEGVTYMTFGFEALPELGEITSMPSVIEDTSRRFYRSTFNTLGLLGRKTFHESFHPDDEQKVPLYLLFPPGLPRVSVYQAVLEATHISPYEVWRRSRKARSVKQKQDKLQAKGQTSAAAVKE